MKKYDLPYCILLLVSAVSWGLPQTIRFNEKKTESANWASVYLTIPPKCSFKENSSNGNEKLHLL